jgi:hypothetical protein
MRCNSVPLIVKNPNLRLRRLAEGWFGHFNFAETGHSYFAATKPLYIRCVIRHYNYFTFNTLHRIVHFYVLSDII